MFNHEAAMLAYARLARISAQKQQRLGTHRFLLLTGMAACRAGWLDVAERCRAIIVAENTKHFLLHSATFADALREPENVGYFTQLERFCSFEQAEHLLIDNGGPVLVTEPATAGTAAIRELQAITSHAEI